MSKYGNRRSESRDGHTFASKRERDRYEELLLSEAAGIIRSLCRQVRFPLVVQVDHGETEIKVGTYVADFVYEEWRGLTPEWVSVVEDSKGVRTQVYLLKKKLMKALHNVDILET